MKQATLFSITELSADERKLFQVKRGDDDRRYLNQRPFIDPETGLDAVAFSYAVIRPMTAKRRQAVARLNVPLKHNLAVLVVRWKKLSDGKVVVLKEWSFFDSACGHRDALRLAMSAVGRA